MINEILSIIKNNLNGYFKLITSFSADQVVYIDGTKTDPLVFPPNSVVPMLINIEEEKLIRQANGYAGIIKNGIKTGLNPSIGINIFVLFVSSFSDYEQSLQFLSLMISYFQKLPVLDHNNTPALPGSVDKVVIELITLPMALRNELWSSLKTTYRPSVLYKMGVLIFHDDTSVEVAKEIVEIQIKTSLQ
jgi:Pvc16 N-terminal domain